MPFVYFHYGYGNFKGSGAGVVQDVSNAGTSYDVGAGLDFTALPILTVGVSAGYNVMDTDTEPVKWIDIGAHVNIAF
jgi:hypothetical protein